MITLTSVMTSVLNKINGSINKELFHLVLITYFSVFNVSFLSFLCFTTSRRFLCQISYYRLCFCRFQSFWLLAGGSLFIL